MANKNKPWTPPLSHYTGQLLMLPYANLNRTIQDLSFGKLSCLATSKFNPFIGVYAYINVTTTERGSQDPLSPYQINQSRNIDVVQTLVTSNQNLGVLSALFPATKPKYSTI